MSEPPSPSSSSPPVPSVPAGRLRISGSCVIDLDEIKWRFQPSGGPGGQHANKTSTRVEVRFDIEVSPSLTENQRTLLIEKLGPTLVLTVDETRSQNRNRAIALERLQERIAAALVRPRPRRPTKPSKASGQRRLDEKKRRGDTKRDRSRPPTRDE